jgi:hypothetical protein
VRSSTGVHVPGGVWLSKVEGVESMFKYDYAIYRYILIVMSSNGRIAMLGLIALAFTEYVKGTSLV